MVDQKKLSSYDEDEEGFVASLKFKARAPHRDVRRDVMENSRRLKPDEREDYTLPSEDNSSCILKDCHRKRMSSSVLCSHHQAMLEEKQDLFEHVN